MLRSFVLAVPFLSVAVVSAQSDQVFLKDGTPVGGRAEVVQECITAMKEDKSTSFMDPAKACACVVDMIAQLDVDTTDLGERDGKAIFQEILRSDTVAGSALLACVAGSLRTDVPISKFGPEFFRSVITECAEGMAASPELEEAGVEPEGTCRCIFEEARRKGLTLGDISAMQDQSSVHFNEILVPCIQKNVRTAGTGSGGGRQLGSPEVSGKSNNQRLSMLHLGSAFKVKVRMGGVERYFILDSGASDCMIPASLEKELLAKQAIRRDQYLEASAYKLADGRTVACRRVTMNGVGLGDFTVRNVVVAVIDEEVQPLLGKSLLDKFEKWTVDPQTATLLLQRQ